ncbi:MAG: hypothetical protein Q9217_003020 [Psora testacea]
MVTQTSVYAKVYNPSLPSVNSSTSCGNCRLYAEEVQVFYWPTESVNGNCARATSASLAPTSITSRSEMSRTLQPSAMGGHTIDVIDGFTFTYPSIYISIIGGISMSDSCGPRGTAHTKPPPIAVSAITTASYASWPTVCRPQGNYENVVIDTLPLSDIACPTWGLSDPFSTTCEGSVYLTATYGTPYNPVILAPQEILAMDTDWAACTKGVKGPLTLPCGIYDPPRTLSAADGLVAPEVTPSPDPNADLQPSAEPGSAGSPTVPPPTMTPHASGDPPRESAEVEETPQPVQNSAATESVQPPKHPNDPPKEQDRKQDEHQSDAQGDPEVSGKQGQKQDDPKPTMQVDPGDPGKQNQKQDDTKPTSQDTPGDPGKQDQKQDQKQDDTKPATQGDSGGLGEQDQKHDDNKPATQGEQPLPDHKEDNNQSTAPGDGPPGKQGQKENGNQSASQGDQAQAAKEDQKPYSSNQSAAPGDTAVPEKQGQEENDNEPAPQVAQEPNSRIPKAGPDTQSKPTQTPSPPIPNNDGPSTPENILSKTTIDLNGQRPNPAAAASIGAIINVAFGKNGASEPKDAAEPTEPTAKEDSSGGGGGSSSSSGAQGDITARFTPTQITVLGQTISITNPSSVAIASTTLSVGGPALTTEGQWYSLAASGKLIGGIISGADPEADMMKRPPPQPPATSPVPSAEQQPTLAALTLAHSTYTANTASQIIIASQTLTPGGSITVFATAISEDVNGAFAIIGEGRSTQSLFAAGSGAGAGTDTGTGTGAGAGAGAGGTDAGDGVFTIAGQTITANPTAFPIAGTTLYAGSAGMTVNGTPVSLEPSGTLLVGTSRTGLVGGTERSESAVVFEGSGRRLFVPGLRGVLGACVMGMRTILGLYL